MYLQVLNGQILFHKTHIDALLLIVVAKIVFGMKSFLTLCMKELMGLNALVLFVALCALTLLLLIIKQAFIIDQIAAFEILEERGHGGIFALIAGLRYLSIPVIYLWKFTVTALLLWLGGSFLGHRVTYASCWTIAAAAEYVFVVPELLKIGWFLFVETDPGYFEVRTFYPFSLINVVDIQQLGEQWMYPLKALNVFEVLYWFLLVAGVHLYICKRYAIAFSIVFYTYVPLFIFWLLYYLVIHQL
jgi:hypothetical protein